MPAAVKTKPYERPAPTTRRTSGVRQRLKTATSATSGWAKRLKARLEDQRAARTPLGR